MNNLTQLSDSEVRARSANVHERKARKVAFLPRQVERKVVRAARLALNNTGEVKLSDGTVVRRMTDQA